MVTLMHRFRTLYLDMCSQQFFENFHLYNVHSYSLVPLMRLIYAILYIYLLELFYLYMLILMIMAVY